jgi:predicted PurR-regulated permease PerM
MPQLRKGRLERAFLVQEGAGCLYQNGRGNNMNRPQSNLVIYLVALASIFVILFGIRGSADIINPILLAAVITITVLPIPSRLTKRGMPGWLALVVSILMVVLLLALVIATVFFSITKLSTELPANMASASQQASADLSATTDSATSAQIEQVTISMGPVLQGMLANVANLLVQFGLALAIFCFMISAALALPTPARLGLDPNAAGIGRVASLTEDVRKYMTVLTGVNFLVAVGDTIFLMVLGVDYAVLWGLLAWFMGYIPSIGFLIALVPPVLMAYIQYGLNTAIIVLVGFVLINGGVQNFYQPKVMGDKLRISPVVVFIGLFVWGYLLGGIGAILAVPMTILVLTMMENFKATRPLAVLMRYTGEEKKGERQEAAKQVQGVWGKLKGTFSSDPTSDEKVDAS